MPSPSPGTGRVQPHSPSVLERTNRPPAAASRFLAAEQLPDAGAFDDTERPSNLAADPNSIAAADPNSDTASDAPTHARPDASAKPGPYAPAHAAPYLDAHATPHARPHAPA